MVRVRRRRNHWEYYVLFARRWRWSRSAWVIERMQRQCDVTWYDWSEPSLARQFVHAQTTTNGRVVVLGGLKYHWPWNSDHSVVWLESCVSPETECPVCGHLCRVHQHYRNSLPLLDFELDHRHFHFVSSRWILLLRVSPWLVSNGRNETHRKKSCRRWSWMPQHLSRLCGFLDQPFVVSVLMFALLDGDSTDCPCRSADPDLRQFHLHFRKNHWLPCPSLFEPNLALLK